MKQHQIYLIKNATHLGLSFDEYRNWTNIQQIICKANSVNAFIRRNISFCPLQIKKMCVLAMVRPILEHAGVHTQTVAYTS